MSNWRSSLLYRAALPMRLRPVLGASLNMVGGSRKLAPVIQAGKDISADKPKIAAWGYTGLGALFGLEYLLSPDWALHSSLRYDFTFSSVSSPLVIQLGTLVTF
jgi:hypothetical protein